jgi:hypothetical protein
MIRPAIALDPRGFGRRFAEPPAAVVTCVGENSLASDIRLFAVTFVGGFLFVSIFLA